MRTTLVFRCAYLRTLGLDSAKQHSAAEIKAAFLERVKATHPDAGGDAARFRQLKDAYDALRGAGAAAGTSMADTPFYADSPAPPPSDRSHIYGERFNDGDVRQAEQQQKRAWDYGSGTRYANGSTRSFYRPYASNYHDPAATGFTREEVARAELAMRLHMLRRLLWNFAIYGSAVYLLYEYVIRRDEQPLSTDYELGLTEQERRRRSDEMRRMQPRLQEHWSDREKARYLEEWNNRYRDRERVVSHELSLPFSDVALTDIWHPAVGATSSFQESVQRTAVAFAPHSTYCDVDEGEDDYAL